MRAHDCYTLGCSVDGISEVLLVVKQWVPTLLSLKHFSLMVSGYPLSMVATILQNFVIHSLSNVPVHALGVLCCFALLFDLACFFLSSLIKNMHIYRFVC